MTSRRNRHHRSVASSRANHRKPQKQRDYLRLVTFNMQWGTPAEGWPDVQPAKTRVGAFTRGLHEWFRGLFTPGVPGSINARTELSGENFREVARILNRLDPDVVALQEVDKGQRRSGYVREAQVLADALKLNYWRMGAAYAGQSQVLHRRPLDSDLRAESGYGVALLSRWPVKSWHYKRLGRMRARLIWGSNPWKGFSRGFVEGIKTLPQAKKGTRLSAGQMRVLLAARLATPWGNLALGNIHLEIHRPTANSQLRRAWRSVYGLNRESCLLVGDYNLREHAISKALKPLPSEVLPALHGYVESYPADKPWICLDQLLGNGWELVGGPQTLRLPISDHRAVIYDLRPVSRDVQ